MVSKKELLLKSIRELLALNVPRDEILLNLREVGIGKEQGRKLIEEAREPEPKTAKETPADSFLEKMGKSKPGKRRLNRREKAEQIERKREQATEELAAESVNPEEAKAEEIAKEIGVESPAKKAYMPQGDLASIVTEIKKPVLEKEKAEEETKPFVKRLSLEEKPLAGKPPAFVKTGPLEAEEKPAAARAEAPPRLVEDIKISKLWEKGILGTVNQRLSEMKELKHDIDKLLDKKVAEATKRELEKIRVLFDSQRALLVSKLDSELEAKAKGFATMIELKLREMREINKQVADQLESLEDAEKKSRAEEESLSKRLKELDKLKESLVASLNSEVIQSKSQGKQLVTEMNEKLRAMDERINKTLQLENQIVEGLAREAEQRIEKMIDSKLAKFAEESRTQLQKLQGIKASFEIEQRQKLAGIEEEFHTSRAAMDNQIRERLIRLDKLQKAITVEFKPEKFKLQMQELDEFKAQFVDAIQRNAEKFNKGIRRLNHQSQVIEKQFTLRAEKIDKKIAELDAFEKNFAKEIGLSLEKMTKKPKKKS